MLFIIFLSFIFWPRYVACTTLVPQPGMEPRPLAVKALSPNYWTTLGNSLILSSPVFNQLLNLSIDFFGVVYFYVLGFPPG